jgi:E3 ubiquitin-protein ligase HUWE1
LFLFVVAGGVFRSWATDLCRYFLDPNFALFMPSKDRPDLFLPSPSSSIHARHLAWFKAIGRFIGKMACRNADSGDPVFLPGGFTDGFLGQILGIEDPIGSTFLDEMRSFDLELHNQLEKLISMPDVDDLGLTFDMSVDNFGEKTAVELVPNGKNIEVTDANKKEYVEKTCEMKLRRQAPAQVAAFREGFLQAFPSDGLSVLEPPDLALLIFGKTTPLDIPALRSVVRVAAVGMAPNCLEWYVV